jgi:hypothetical protein
MTSGFVLTLILGVAVVTAISLSPLYARRLPHRRSDGLGAAVVLAAVGLAAIAAAAPAGTAGIERVLFPCAFVLLLAGTLLLLGEQPDGRSEGDDRDPPWWPEFESGFRSYARRRREPVAGR